MIIGILLPLLVLIFKDHLSLNSIERFSPLIIMVMLNMTVGGQICKALFYHVDKPLMRYPFYRQHAKKHFLLRFRSILRINLKLGSCLAICNKCIYTCINWRTGYTFTTSYLGYNHCTGCIFLSTSSVVILCNSTLHNGVGNQQSSFLIRKRPCFIEFCCGDVSRSYTMGTNGCHHGVDFSLSIQRCLSRIQICSKQF